MEDGMAQQATRLLLDDAASRGSRRPWAAISWTAIHRSLLVRLLAAFLIVSLPAVILLAVVLSRQASGSLTSYASLSSENTARAASTRLEAWLEERQADLTTDAQAVTPDIGKPALPEELTERVRAQADDLLMVTDPAGHPVASSAPALAYDAGQEQWFAAATQGYTVNDPEVVGSP